MRFIRQVWGILGCVGGLMLIGTSADAQLRYEEAPIHYNRPSTEDAVAKLQKLLDDGHAELQYDEEKGYLPSLLKHLGVSQKSQVMVFSKTSFQIRRISPHRPRALYYNDDNYVGWVQFGDVIEVMSTDPEQGTIFYTLSQEKQEKPKFVRDQGTCLTCHSSSRTQGVPGGVVRSFFVNAGGQPHYGSRTFATDQSSPFSERWGGWYVTGTHGSMRHMGNVISNDRSEPEQIDREEGANEIDLSDRFDTEPYLTPHSDLVSLMVLEHQTQMHNLITAANFETRSARHHDQIMNKALERDENHVSDTTGRRIASAAEKLVDHMLFVDEFQLTSPVAGTSGFAEEFQAIGPQDSKKRSLRQLNLRTRLLEYPCSYLIYSESFDRLPEVVRKKVATELHQILTGVNTDEKYDHLTPKLRTAILEILNETKPGLWELLEPQS